MKKCPIILPCVAALGVASAALAENAAPEAKMQNLNSSDPEKVRQIAQPTAEQLIALAKKSMTPSDSMKGSIKASRWSKEAAKTTTHSPATVGDIARKATAKGSSSHGSIKRCPMGEGDSVSKPGVVQNADSNEAPVKKQKDPKAVLGY